MLVVDSARVVTFVAEFSVVVAADDDIVLVIIFAPSFPHFKFSFATFSFASFSYLMVFCGFFS